MVVYLLGDPLDVHPSVNETRAWFGSAYRSVVLSANHVPDHPSGCMPLPSLPNANEQ